MEREIYERLDEEARKEFISTRQAESQERMEERKKRIAFFKESVKQGLAYAKLNHREIMFFEGFCGDVELAEQYSLPIYGVSAAAILQTGPKQEVYYQVGYSLRKPSDNYSSRISKGLAAYRTIPGITSVFSFKINLSKPGGVKPERMRALIANHIQMDLLTARVPAPTKIGRSLVTKNEYVELFTVKFEKEEQKTVRQHSIGSLEGDVE